MGTRQSRPTDAGADARATGVTAGHDPVGNAARLDRTAATDASDPFLALSVGFGGDGHGDTPSLAAQTAPPEEGPDAARGSRRASAPASKPDALARHQRNLGRVRRIVDSGLSIDPDPTQGFASRPNLLHNAAQWIDTGQATLKVLTPTHDAHLRPSVAPEKLAYFDNRVDFRADGADYDATLDASGQATDDAGLTIDFANVVGSMGNDGVTLSIMDPTARSESSVVDTIIHEVQHDADQHTAGAAWEARRPGPDPAALERAPQWAYNSYQTEFRAYWIENPEGSAADNYGSSTDLNVANFAITVARPGPDGAVRTADDTTTSATTSFANARQESIFRHLFEARDDNVYWDGTAWVSSYAYVPYWYVLDPAYRAMIDAYVRPVGGNLIDSPRIQALSAALTAHAFDAATTAAAALDELDRAYLQDHAQSQPFWDQLHGAGFDATQQAALEAAIGTPIAADQATETVVVQAGDTLSSLADRYLGSADRWPEIHALNHRAIGPDPNRIRRGLVLRLPTL